MAASRTMLYAQQFNSKNKIVALITAYLISDVAMC